jgi:pRiA4b ORF-3-like protein
MVWRRIQVPEPYSFWDFHVAIQDAMGFESRTTCAEPFASFARAPFDHLRLDSTELLEPLPAEPRLGRRTSLTFPLLPPPQKN